MNTKIIELFLYHDSMKFNEIAKKLSLKSNKLAYDLKQLMNKNILVKDKENYKLSDSYECLIPHISNKNSVLPVVLVCIKEDDKVFLYKRTKKPFKDCLSLPGGRLLIKEDIKASAKRIMKEKFNIDIYSVQIRSISLEHVIRKKDIIHSFLLILVSAKSRQNIDLVGLNKNKKNIIPSDYRLINNLDSTNIRLKSLKTFIK